MATATNDLLIEEARKKLESRRKKAIRYNLLIILFFCVVIIGVAGAIYYYNQLKTLNDKVSTAEAKLTIQNKSLDSLSKELEKANNRLSTQKNNLENIIDSASTAPAGLNILRPVVNKRDQAREFAREGYKKLREKDFAAAKTAFDKSEAAYNGYRHSFEISNLLKKYKDKLNDPATQKLILETVYKEYNSLELIKRADLH